MQTLQAQVTFSQALPLPTNKATLQMCNSPGTLEGQSAYYNPENVITF